VETNRWRKKVEREVPFMTAVKDLSQSVEKCIEQNNQIDLFEEYFVDEISEHLTENITTKTLMLFKYSLKI
jgi:dynein intermediate chain 2, axonemal